MFLLQQKGLEYTHFGSLDQIDKADSDSVLKDDTELFKQFSENEGFRRWMADTVFGLTYESVPL